MPMETWHHIADGLRGVDWQTNGGLSKRLLKAFIGYYFAQFPRQWVLETVLEVLQEHGLTTANSFKGENNVTRPQH